MTSLAHLAAAAPTGEAIDAAGFRHLIFTPEIMSRCVHIWLAGVATVGILIAWLSVRKNIESSEQPSAARLTVFGGRLALAATLLQLPVGMWLLMQSPAGEQSRLMGGSLLPTALLVASIIAALALLHQLAAIALGGGERSHVRWSAALLIVTVLMMSATLRLSRGNAWSATCRTQLHCVQDELQIRPTRLVQSSGNSSHTGGHPTARRPPRLSPRTAFRACACNRGSGSR